MPAAEINGQNSLPKQFSENGHLNNHAIMEKIIYEVTEMELADIRNELEKTAKILADFRGSL